MKKISSVCRLAEDKNFEVTVNIYYDETNEFDEGEMTFTHVRTGTEHDTVDQVLSTWSEEDVNEQKKWCKLVEAIENDELLSQKIFDEREIIEY